jgi:hypothetical protein
VPDLSRRSSPEVVCPDLLDQEKPCQIDMGCNIAADGVCTVPDSKRGAMRAVFVVLRPMAPLSLVRASSAQL